MQVKDNNKLLASPRKTSPATPSRKRTRGTTTPRNKIPIVDPTQDEEDAGSSHKKRKTVFPGKAKDEEKRLKMFRKYAPKSYLEKLSRAQGQRCDDGIATMEQEC